MEGFQAPYVPGFDTHGLPIELKALSSVGEKKKDISKLVLHLDVFLPLEENAFLAVGHYGKATEPDEPVVFRITTDF